MSKKEIRVTTSGVVLECSDNKHTQEYIKQKGKSNILITQAMITRFMEMKHMGLFRIKSDWEEASKDAELSPVSYWTILENYKELLGKFGMIDWEEIKEYKGENNGKNNI